MFATGSVMGFMYSDSHQLAPEGSRPPVATSPRAHEPLIPDREALRLCSILLLILLVLYYCCYH
jgi:hypothetical protein